MKILFNILMSIIVWYVPQFVVGYIIGFVGSMMNKTMDDVYVTVCVLGIMVSIASEVIYWKYQISKKRTS